MTIPTFLWYFTVFLHIYVIYVFDSGIVVVAVFVLLRPLFAVLWGFCGGVVSRGGVLRSLFQGHFRCCGYVSAHGASEASLGVSKAVGGPEGPAGPASERSEPECSLDDPHSWAKPSCSRQNEQSGPKAPIANFDDNARRETNPPILTKKMRTTCGSLRFAGKTPKTNISKYV